LFISTHSVLARFRLQQQSFLLQARRRLLTAPGAVGPTPTTAKVFTAALENYLKTSITRTLNKRAVAN